MQKPIGRGNGTFIGIVIYTAIITHINIRRESYDSSQIIRAAVLAAAGVNSVVAWSNGEMTSQMKTS